MEKAAITLQFKPPLKKKLEALAWSERRTGENQALCLIEIALREIEDTL